MSGTLNNASSWAPVGESSADILAEALDLISTTTINAVTYGVALTLYILCMYALYHQLSSGRQKRQAIFNTVYITVLFATGTVYLAVNSRETQLAFVNNRNFPGGPSAYSVYTYSSPLNIGGAVAFFLTTWMNDALLVWRLSVLYRRAPFSTPIVSFVVIAYLATFAMGMVTLIEAVSPNQTLWVPISVPFARAYYSLTVAFTIVITGLMVTRILLTRRAFIKATGHKGHGAEYVSIAAMIIESSALYTIWGIIFLGLYIADHPVQYVFLSSLSEVQIIAPLLIMYRVSMGKAWGPNTTQALSSIQFNAENKQSYHLAEIGTAASSNRTLTGRGVEDKYSQGVFVVTDTNVN
ncbi:hypothetical protein CVT24_013027 [Panaeolus cyanescens]|uniref:G-protein coupled receptors family 1 profile domain-containing protein n=1 Tax=Panaeolus cyanescens TaxID=181874 RepID=A0A409YUK1_9AGAR|nr:hypothetical protein CVT24_013027 [Panaeolus cyanescens]